MFIYLPCPTHSYAKILMPDRIVLGDGTFERWLGHKGEALVNNSSVLVKGMPLSSQDPWLCDDTMRSLQPWRSPSPNHAGIPISDFQPPQLWEIIFYCLSTTQPVVFCYSSPIQDILLCISTREMKTYIHINTWIQIFIPALFVIHKNWKQLKCLSTGKEINKLSYTHTLSYYLAIFFL